MTPISLLRKSSSVPNEIRVPVVSPSAGTPVTTLGLDSRRARLAGPALILLAAAIATFPIWYHGPAAGDDFEFHLI